MDGMDFLDFLDRGYRSNPILESLWKTIHPKQRTFLEYEGKLCLFGGAAGGGKSQALLMAACQYLDVPGYAAIIFRRTYVDLSQPGALMDSALRLFSRIPWARRQDGGRKWVFDTRPGKPPATLSFAHLDNSGDRFNYQGAEYQFIGFDELTQHPEENFRYLFSRLRRPRCDEHGQEMNEHCPVCQIVHELASVPLRMRCTSNPGGEYGEWVKELFVVGAVREDDPDGPEYLLSSTERQFSGSWDKHQTCQECSGSGRLRNENGREEPCLYCEGEGVRRIRFIPSRLQDNPSLDVREYRQSLIFLGEAERHRLESGRWDVTEKGNLFQQEWIRHYTLKGEISPRSRPIPILHRPGMTDAIYDSSSWSYFVTADTASTLKSYSDYTVICVWGYNVLTYDLILCDVLRDRMEVPAILPEIVRLYKQWGCSEAVIENKSSGIGIIQQAYGPQGQGMAIIPYQPGTLDKVSRSTIAQQRMQGGKVYFPTGNPFWLDPFLSELMGFPVFQHDDCVDNVTMACHHVSRRELLRVGTSPPSQIGDPVMFPVLPM